MHRIVLILIIILSFNSCKSSKRAKQKKASAPAVNIEKIDEASEDTKVVNLDTKKTKKSKVDHIIDFAKQFRGVRYKWGGTTKAGMDCSGLVYESFRNYEVYLPRISRDMAKKGHKVSLKKVKKGDLLFFKTGNRRNTINHVGLIVEIKNNDIKFIHATSSKGVIISGLNETYWLKAFHEARSIL